MFLLGRPLLSWRCWIMMKRSLIGCRTWQLIEKMSGLSAFSELQSFHFKILGWSIWIYSFHENNLVTSFQLLACLLFLVLHHILTLLSAYLQVKTLTRCELNCFVFALTFHSCYQSNNISAATSAEKKLKYWYIHTGIGCTKRPIDSSELQFNRCSQVTHKTTKKGN